MAGLPPRTPPSRLHNRSRRGLTLAGTHAVDGGQVIIFAVAVSQRDFSPVRRS